MSASTQQNFRSQLSSFRWANSVQDDSQPAAGSTAAGASTNPFSRAWTGVSSYIPLQGEGRSQEEEAYFALSVSRRHVLGLDDPGIANIVEMGAVPRIFSLLCWRYGLFRDSVPLFTYPWVEPLTNPEPVLISVAIKPRKFALAFTLGSLLFMLGFAILHGPWNRECLPHGQHFSV